MKRIKLNWQVLALLGGVVIGVSGCNGVDDLFKIDIDRFSVDKTSVAPEERFRIDWRTKGPLIFDVRVLLSEDSRISTDDLVVIDEECDLGANRHCAANQSVAFECLYQSDLSLTCREGGDQLSRTDLTPLLDELPKDTFVILEICGDRDRKRRCESRSAQMRFE